MVEINLKLKDGESTFTITAEHTSIEEIDVALVEVIDGVFRGLIERGFPDNLIKGVLQSIHEEANERVFKMLINRKQGIKNDE